MNIPEEAIEAAAFAFWGKQFCTDSECEGCEYELSETRSALEAAIPAIEKELRAQVAAEVRCELPVQLAETAQSPSGWLSDAQIWLPEPDALYERIDLVCDCGGGVCSIDISHIAEHAAQIAERVSK